MREFLSYLYTRATTSKSWRCYSNEESTPRFSNVIDLAVVTIGKGLTFGLVVILGSVAKSGPSVLLSIWIAVLVNFLTGLYFAELRSRYARVQATPHQYVFFASGGLAAFVMGWLDLLKHATCASAIAKSFSIYLDIQTDLSIRNFTVSRLGIPQVDDSYLDLPAFALMLGVMLFVFFTWYRQFVKQEHLAKVTVACLVVMALCVLGVAVSHLKFGLWKEATFDTFTVIRDAAIILLAVSTTHSVFCMSDFVWLGIKPTVLVSYTLATLLTPGLLSMLCALLTLLSSWHSWTTDAVAIEAFQRAGITWFKYALGPLIVLCLPSSAMEHFTIAIQTTQEMAFDNLIPSVLQKPKSSKLPSFLATGLIGVATSFAALSVDIVRLLEIGALCAVLQQVFICCVVTILRYRPSYHMHVLSRAHQEDSNLIGQNPVEGETPINRERLDTIGDYLYGAFSNNNAESAVAIRDYGCHDDDDEGENIDEAVEEFRLQSAIQCYKSALQTRVKLHKTPKIRSFQCVKSSMVIFTAVVLNIALTVIQGWHQLKGMNVALMLWLIASVVVATVCLVLISLQPTDKILPRTMLIQAPVHCVVAMAVITCLVAMAATQEVVTWTICIIWLCAGLLCYLLNCIHTRGTSTDLYRHLTTDSNESLPTERAQANAFHSFTTDTTTGLENGEPYSCAFAHGSDLSTDADPIQSEDHESTSANEAVTLTSGGHVTSHVDDDRLVLCEHEETVIV